MALTKAHIIDVVHAELGFPKNQSINLIETLIELILWRGCHDQRFWQILR